MINNPSPDFSLFDQALLICSDGHCLFDENGLLLSWSETFGNFYPQLADRIKPGYAYRQFVRDLMEFQVLKNFKRVENIDEWVEKHIESIQANNEFIHHLSDGRYMAIRKAVLSNGYWFFAASEITDLISQRDALEENKKKFESFAIISSDWFWELDEKLKYKYFSSHNAPLGIRGKNALIGESRLDHVLTSAVDNSQRRQHNKALHQREPVDVILTFDNEQNGDEPVHVQVFGIPQFDKNGIFKGYLGCAKNVTEEYGMKKRLEFQAGHDELTGLINRRAFGHYLKLSFNNRSLAEINEHAAPTHQTLIFVDLDQFKLVNDNAGHLAGDQLLIDVTNIFNSVFPSSNDIVARLGGDEFAILSTADKQTAKEKTEELIRLVGEYRFRWDERKFSIGASAGIVTLDDHASDDSELLSKADAACYSAKMSGRNQVHLYSSGGAFDSNRNDEIGKLELINETLLHDRMSLFLQPIVPTRAQDENTKFEVLLRLKDSNGEVVPPGGVIPVAEKYDRMQHLDLWVVENSIKSFTKFADLGVPVALSVNLSGNTLSNESCLNRIAGLVEKYQIEPETLCFEVTETAAIKSMDKALNFIEHLKELRCQFSLDDFGSGLSSFSYLRSLPVDYLKIDGCFVSDLIDDKANRAIVTSFNTLAHELGIKTVAEYVETDEIAALLTEMDIDYLQGFGVGKPQFLDEWLELYREQPRLTGT